MLFQLLLPFLPRLQLPMAAAAWAAAAVSSGSSGCSAVAIYAAAAVILDVPGHRLYGQHLIH